MGVRGSSLNRVVRNPLATVRQTIHKKAYRGLGLSDSQFLVQLLKILGLCHPLKAGKFYLSLFGPSLLLGLFATLCRVV